MNKGPNQPFHRTGGRRRRRKHSGGGQGGQHAGHQGRRGRPRRGAAFVGPMDHSYRNALQNGQGGSAGGFRAPGAVGPHFQHPELEPLPQEENPSTRVFAFVEDLFFLTKIRDTGRKLNVNVEFVKTDKDILDKVEQNGGGPPSLIIIDLNNTVAKPLATIPKLRSRFKKGTSIVGFVSHVQGDLKVKAMEAGCDAVMPRSAFSQNLPQLLRRHGATVLPPE